MINMWDIVSVFNDVTTILVALVVLLVIGYVILMQERSGIPPGPPFWPVVGNMLDMRDKFAGKRHKYYAELQAKYGDIFRIYFGDQLLIVLNDFESIEEAFVKQKDLFSTRPVKKLWVVKQVSKIGDGVIWASGQGWKDARRMAIRSLRDLGVGKSTLEERIKEEIHIVLDSFTKSEGKPIKVHEIMMKATTNIISTVVFGKRYDYGDPEFIQIIKILKDAFTDMALFTPVQRFPMLRFIPFIASKMLAAGNAILEVEQFIANRIEKRKKVFDKNDIKDFIDVYLDTCVNNESSAITDGNIRRVILDLYFAGSDTTSTTLDWAVLFMVLHPEVQKKCQEEIDSVVGDGRMVNWSDKSKMSYNEATLLEVQRLGNAVPMSLPHTTDKDTIVKGYLIPEGSLVFANLYACHLDSRYWKEPLKFKPERFLDDSGKVSKQPMAFIPFSIGPRICAGEPLARMELFLFFTNILQRFSVSTPGSQKPSTDGVCGVSMSTPEYTIQATPR
ncbi:cytochrome P450 2D3 [Patella vulgata]|uniref:cytochrome P450 2D3 n=1 Tax=Patella vulgata TaxID=6465 RepID=UPI0021809A4A|nr:cytochrome P450 2D3 [Patella vulgata]XP_050418755.1 cytochrome P450 2D3 [Patella vulgata]